MIRIRMDSVPAWTASHRGGRAFIPNLHSALWKPICFGKQMFALGWLLCHPPPPNTHTHTLFVHSHPYSVCAWLGWPFHIPGPATLSTCHFCTAISRIRWGPGVFHVWISALRMILACSTCSVDVCWVTWLVPHCSIYSCAQIANTVIYFVVVSGERLSL